MPIQNKHTYRQILKNFFYRIRVHPWHERMMMLPFWVRLFIAVILFIIGIIGLLTPIPAGWLMILTAGVLVFGLHMVKRQVVKAFFLLRLHRVIEYIRYTWKK